MENVNIIHLNETASTNTYLANIIHTGIPDKTIVITTKQSNGKGQRTNKWESEAGKNLTFSLLLKPNINVENAFLISKAVSVAIVEVLNKMGKDFAIKWPNDIYYKNKKLSGILIENRLVSNIISDVIIGIGINVNQEKFVSDAPNPISLKNIFNKEFELNSILTDIVQKIIYWYNQILQRNIDEINSKYHSYLYRADNFYPFKAGNNIFDAKIKEVKNDGQLILETVDKNQLMFYFNEIAFMQNN